MSNTGQTISALAKKSVPIETKKAKVKAGAYMEQVKLQEEKKKK